MASIGGLSSSASSGITGTNYKGFGGLASGLDRDSLIEQMTSGIQSKIQKQKQAKQKVTWQQDTIREITNKMVEFSQKYLTFSSSTNLLSNSFFSQANIESIGANSKAVSISGSSSLANEMSVTGVKQLADNAKLSSVLSSNTELSGTINGNLSDKFSVSKLAGESFSIKVGGADEYRISLSNDNISNVNEAVDAINKELEKIDLKTGTGKLSDKIKFSVDSSTGKVAITNFDQAGNDITLQSGENVFRALGVLNPDETLNPYDNDKKIMISNGSPLVAKNAASVTEEKTKRDLLAGTELTFNYNGERKSIGVEGKFTDIDGYVKELQAALDKAYGEKHIKVSNANGKISFDTVDSTGGKDAHSTLSIESASQTGVLGKTGILGIEEGTGNRFNVNQQLGDLGFSFTNGEGSIFVNDKEIKFKESTTVQELMEKIGSEAGVNIRYLQTLDRVTFTSADQGAGSRISFGKNGGDTNSQKFLDMFKIKGTADGSTLAQGKDAILNVKYPGIDDAVEITRSSNSFKLDGIDFKLNSTFGYDENGAYIKGTEAVTFKAKANTEDTTKAVKEMVEAFNAILAEVNEASYTKQTGKTKYEPLTDQQKKEMTESQITEWEKKAKVGILYGDSDLKSLSNALRFVMPSGDEASAKLRQQLADIGISVSTNYSDKGKLVFDEAKFKKAMETNSESVANAIAGGLMKNVKDVMDRYAKVSGADKGILIKRAGSKHSPVSMTKNTMQTKIDSIQKMIDSFEVRLQKDQTRYSNQFTQLEKMISKMNTQSSWLNQQ